MRAFFLPTFPKLICAELAKTNFSGVDMEGAMLDGAYTVGMITGADDLDAEQPDEQVKEETETTAASTEEIEPEIISDQPDEQIKKEAETTAAGTEQIEPEIISEQQDGQIKEEAETTSADTEQIEPEIISEQKKAGVGDSELEKDNPRILSIPKNLRLLNLSLDKI